MKKSISILALLLLLIAPYAINAQSKIVEDVNYLLPETAIKVSVTVATEQIKIGPYARFSQQYLGITAPLNDKTTHTIISSEIDSYDELSLSDIYVLNTSPTVLSADKLEKSRGGDKGVAAISSESGECQSSDILFKDLGINPIVYSATNALKGRTSAREKSLEEMAADAANTIFTLRKRRFDLITGELGEAVFGEGMKDALKEMARIEDEYLSLFVGKRAVTYKTYSYDVTPQVGKNSYILARFSPATGVVEPSNMSGDPVVLTVTPEEIVKAPVEENKKTIAKKVEGIKYRVADMAICKLFFSSELLNNTRLPILQYGIVVEK